MHSILKLPSLLGLISCVSLSAVAQAEPSTNYQKLLSEVEPGEFLVLADLENDLEFFTRKATEYLQYYAELEPEVGIPPLDLEPILEATGFLALDGFALSAAKVDEGYRNTLYLHFPDGLKGIWAHSGTENRELKKVASAPADSMFAMEFYLDNQPVRQMAIDIATAVMGPMGGHIVEGQLQQPIPETTISWDELLLNLSGNWFGFGKFEDTTDGKFALSFVIRLDSAGHLLPRLSQAIVNESIDVSEDAEGNITIRFPAIEGGSGFAGLEPVIVGSKVSGEAFIASSEAYLTSFRAASGPTLADLPEFVAMDSRLPQKAFAKNYFGSSYYQFFLERTQRDLLKVEEPAIKLMAKILDDYYSRFDGPQLAAGTFTDEGLRYVFYSNGSMKEAIYTIPVVAGGFFAAMAVPAYNKVRETAQQKSVTNNLRMLNSAAAQYFVETGETEVISDVLIAEGYAVEPESVAGESYTDIWITEGSVEISVTLPNGRVITYETE